MRTVENRCEISRAILPWVRSANALEYLQLAARASSGRRRLIQDQQIRIAQVSPRQRNLLPLPAGELHATLESASQHLVVSSRELADHCISQALLGRQLQVSVFVRLVHPSNRDILSSRHLKPHEILENNTDVPVQVLYRILPQVHAIKQNLPFGRIIKAA